MQQNKTFVEQPREAGLSSCDIELEITSSICEHEQRVQLGRFEDAE
jgi:hypothetical protein